MAEPRLHGLHSLSCPSDSSFLGTVLYPGSEDKLTFSRQEAPALISADTEEALAEYRALMASDQTVGLNAVDWFRQTLLRRRELRVTPTSGMAHRV